MSLVDRDLVRGVELLSLDAGNTVIFLDHARLAEQGGVARDDLVRAEGVAKRRIEDGTLLDPRWQAELEPGARGWGRTVATMLVVAGAREDAMPALLPRLWKEHVRYNFWSLVPAGLGDALEALRARGIKVAIVSNSEGMLDRLFETLGILRHFDAIVDSGKVGVEKPSPRIFEIAAEMTGKQLDRALHLGDTFATDIAGARAAGMRTALIDPYDHYAGTHADVARVPGVVRVAHAIMEEI